MEAKEQTTQSAIIDNTEDFIKRFMLGINQMAFIKSAENGKYIFGNEPFAVFAGKKSNNDIIGLDDYDLFSKSTAEAIIKDDKATLEINSETNISAMLSDSCGNNHYLNFTRSLYTTLNGDRLIIALITDITENMVLKAKVDKLIKEKSKSSEKLWNELEEQKAKTKDSNKDLLEYIKCLTVDWDTIDIIQFGDCKDNDTIVNKKLSKTVKEIIPEWNQDMSLNGKIMLLINRMVCREDKDTVFKMTRRDNLLYSGKIGKQFEIDFKYENEEEAVLYFKMIFIPINNQNQNLQSLFVGIVNCTEETLKKEEHKKLLADAVAEAKNANESKKMFFYNMSHDLRTPLNAINGFAQLAINNSTNQEKLDSYLGKVKVISGQINKMVNSLLELSLIESGRYTLQNKPHNLCDELNDFVSVFEFECHKRNITLNSELINISHPNAYVDEIALICILNNAFDNALSNSDDYGTIYSRFEETSSDSNEFGLYKWTLEDNGRTVNKDYIGKIFDNFSHNASASSFGISRSGLGMSLAKSLVELMGGQFSIDSSSGNGTKLEITIPFKYFVEDNSYRKYNRMNKLYDKHILLVEDNDLNREIALDLLEDAGMIVDEATNGQDCLNTISMVGINYYDCILMDIQMPVMNGYKATEEIRKRYPDSRIPIIALSSNVYEDDIKKSLSAGMDAHISKPINIHEFFTAITQFLIEK